MGLRDDHRNQDVRLLGALKEPKVRSEFGSERRFRRYEPLKLVEGAHLHFAVTSGAKQACGMAIGSGSVNIGEAEPIRNCLGGAV